jgi:DNA repair exonuclease SbcCD ATPase subunit
MNDWDEIRAILRELAKRQKERDEWGKKIDERIEKLLKDQEKTDEQIKKTHLAIDKLLEDQKRTDEQIKKMSQEIERLGKEREAKFDRLEKEQKKTDEQIKKTDEQIKKTDEQIKRTDEQIKKTDEQIKRTDEQIKKTEEEMRRVFRKMDEEFEKTRRTVEKVTDGWGRFVEGIMSPSAEKVFIKLGYKIFLISHRQKIKNQKREVIGEIDTLLEGKKDGKDVIFVGEAKTSMTSGELSEFIELLSKLKEYLPKYKNYDIIGFVASVNYGTGVDRRAIKNGIYVFRVTDEVAKLSVPKNFKPKIW